MDTSTETVTFTLGTQTVDPAALRARLTALAPRHDASTCSCGGSCPECSAPCSCEAYAGQAEGRCSGCGRLLAPERLAALTTLGLLIEPATFTPALSIDGAGVIALAAIDPANPGRFSATLVVEEEPTADGRVIAKNATTWRPPPLTLMLMTTTAPGHDGATVAGVIEKIRRQGAKIIATGRFDTSPSGIEAARLVRDGVMNGVSIDGGDVEGEILVEGDAGDEIQTLRITAITVLGATLCPMPAIGSARADYIAAAGGMSVSTFLSGTIEWAPDDGSDYDGLFGAQPFRDLPLSDRDVAWDATAAEGSVRAWASSDGSGDADTMDWARYGRAFFWVDSAAADQFGSYKLGFARVEGGDLQAVWRGVTAVAGVLQGARGGVDIPEADQARVKTACGRYYDKAAKQYDDETIKVPWVAEDVEALVAAGPRRYPAGLFADPGLRHLTPVRVLPEDADGHCRVVGHLAPWSTCHIGIPGVCTTAPRSATGYAYFKTGALPLAEGGSQPVGTITLSAPHAGQRLSAREAMLHYDHSGLAAAYVNVGEDAHGIWVAGVLAPNLPEERATELSAASLSGDWRRIGGHMELVAALAVNVPGFPVVGLRDEEQVSLVAAGYGPTQVRQHLAAQFEAVAGDVDARLAAQDATLAALRDEIARLGEMLRPIARERLRSRFAARGAETDDANLAD